MEILPIACTLSRAELEGDAHCLMPGLLKGAPSISELADGVRLEFDAADEALRDAIDVINRERQCCRFLQFVITIPPGGKPFQIDITGPEGTRQFLAQAATIATIATIAPPPVRQSPPSARNR